MGIPWIASLLIAALAAAEGPPHRPPHRGLVAATHDGHLELVIGPDRLALYPLTADLQPTPATGTALLRAAKGEPVVLAAAGDHFEAPNPWGTDGTLELVAIVQSPSGASAARFEFSPGQASTYHDHRSYHGGQVGMAGERHFELALATAGGGGEELQLYLTDAYRQPVGLQGISARAKIAENGRTRELPLRESGDCFTAAVPRSKSGREVHVAVTYPGEAAPVEMDFYFSGSSG
jgi:hypothetical protein